MSPTWKPQSAAKRGRPSGSRSTRRGSTRSPTTPKTISGFTFNPEQAAAGPFGTTVAHGFLTLSLLPYFASQLSQIEGVRMGINYGLNRVRFPAPVRVGSRLRARATMTELDKREDGSVQLVTLVTVEIEGEAKPACVAEMVGRYYFG